MPDNSVLMSAPLSNVELTLQSSNIFYRCDGPSSAVPDLYFRIIADYVKCFNHLWLLLSSFSTRLAADPG